MHSGTGTRISFAKSTGSFWVGSRQLNGGILSLAGNRVIRQLRALLRPIAGGVHLCRTFRPQNNPIFGSKSVKKFHVSYGREEETGPRNYGPFLILIHAVSAAIPRGMAIASTIVSTFIGFFDFPIYCGLRAERLNRTPCRWR
jgi:hypothetical protein